MEGLLILIATLLVMLVAAIFTIYKIFAGPKLPKGHRFESTYKGNEAIVLVDPKLDGLTNKKTGKVDRWIILGSVITGKELATACAKAIYAVELSFLEQGIEKAEKDSVVFSFQTDDTFENTPSAPQWKNWSKGAEAYSITISGVFGIKHKELAVIRTKFIKTVLSTGQPVIHELVHILHKTATEDENKVHDNALLWTGPGGDDSMESKAAAIWEGQ